MTRVSLREAYDNKDVIAQIYAIRDTAESAVDTSEQAVTTANTASDHVDALVPQVEGAVANAKSASASAQASAQTVAGYENRLATVEGEVAQTESDLNAVTLRVTTAEGQIVTIQGRVTALETADGQNVKLTGEHAIGNYAVLLTGNQSKSGELSLINRLIRNWDVNVKVPSTSYQSSDFLRMKPPAGSLNTSDIAVIQMVREATANYLQFIVFGADVNDTAMSAGFRFSISNTTGKASISVRSASGSYLTVWSEP